MTFAELARLVSVVHATRALPKRAEANLYSLFWPQSNSVRTPVIGIQNPRNNG
jgi:hypothetical protein